MIEFCHHSWLKKIPGCSDKKSKAFASDFLSKEFLQPGKLDDQYRLIILSGVAAEEFQIVGIFVVVTAF